MPPSLAGDAGKAGRKPGERTAPVEVRSSLVWVRATDRVDDPPYQPVTPVPPGRVVLVAVERWRDPLLAVYHDEC